MFALSHGAPEVEALWRFMPYGPFAGVPEMSDWLKASAAVADSIPFVARELSSGRIAGMICYLRLTPAHGCGELGGIWYPPAFQRTKINTEAVYLLLRHLFEDLGYRRAEWKCHHLNERSRASAARLGFVFEGVFRRHMVLKGENRDTVWFSMLDAEWPLRKANFERWLYSPDSPSLTSLNRSAA